MGFPGDSDGKASACNAGDKGSIPGLGRSPGEGNGNPLQYSCWKIPWTGEPGRLQSIGLQSWTQLSNFTSYFYRGWDLEKEKTTHYSILAWRIPWTV